MDSKAVLCEFNHKLVVRNLIILMSKRDRQSSGTLSAEELSDAECIIQH